MAKILVVDDNEQNCELVKDILCAWGHNVYKAYQGLNAIKYALAARPDIILLDVMLPGMNGFEVCHELKNNPETQNIPIIMLSVLTDVEDRIRGLKVGADIFLSKPVNYQELRYHISALIERKKATDKMESPQRVLESFLEIMKICRPQLYKHSARVHEYCAKVAGLMAMPDEQQERLAIAACLHDIGKIATESGAEHAETGARLVGPLKMGEWLTAIIEQHHTAPQHRYAETAEIGILRAVNRFVNLWELSGDKEKSIAVLENEAKTGVYDDKATGMLRQLIKDEKFIQSLSNNPPNPNR